MLDIMLKLGGKRWTKNGMDRVYLDISKAEEAYKRLDDSREFGSFPCNRNERNYGKIWLDLYDNEIKISGFQAVHEDEVKTAMMEIINSVRI